MEVEGLQKDLDAKLKLLAYKQTKGEDIASKGNATTIERHQDALVYLAKEADEIKVKIEEKTASGEQMEEVCAWSAIKWMPISPSQTPRGCPRRSAEGLTRLQAGSHFPEKIQGTGKKSNITRSCAICFPPQKKILARTGEKRNRPGKESSFRWNVCKVALCIQDCFQLYHTVQDYVAVYIRRHDANNDNADDDN